MELSIFLTTDECCNIPAVSIMKMDNMPNEDQIKNLKNLGSKVYDPLVWEFGPAIGIKVGFIGDELRSKFYTGKEYARHATGEAFDLEVKKTGSGVTNADVFNFIRKNILFDELVWVFGNDEEPSSVRVAVCHEGPQRGVVMKSFKNKSGYKERKY